MPARTTLDACLSCALARCAGWCACSVDGELIAAHAAAGDCPRGRHVGLRVSAQAEPLSPGTPPEGWTAPADNPWGPPMWAELHRRPWECADLEGEPAWLAGFALRVPCGECRSHWLALVAAHPPDLASRKAYHAWTVARHDDVSRRLGKGGVDECGRCVMR